VLSFLHTGFFPHAPGKFTGMMTLLFLGAGIVLIILSSVFLGRSVRIGLPKEDTTIKTGGIYRYSRNPMYVGAHLVTLSSMVYTLHVGVILLGIYSFIVYHLIILGEEKFLGERFGSEYENYKQRVRRYL
jgi:protein-S-isoprenylcysteine O-methyltransferase Ste14